jgi:hypothetical protein
MLPTPQTPGNKIGKTRPVGVRPEGRRPLPEADATGAVARADDRHPNRGTMTMTYTATKLLSLTLTAAAVAAGPAPAQH